MDYLAELVISWGGDLEDLDAYLQYYYGISLCELLEELTNVEDIREEVESLELC